MIKTWFTDSFAQMQHQKMACYLKPLIAEFLGPLYELSHVGISKNDETGEVKLMLHLNPIGRIKSHSDPLLIGNERRPR